VIVVRTVVNPDPAARRNVVAALSGPGAPAGVRDCRERDDLVSVTFDDAVAHAERIDALITIATHFVEVRGPAPLEDGAAARLSAVGLGEPDLADVQVFERQRAGLE
jgi:hypothetical protein